jgi:hypothetical protein
MRSEFLVAAFALSSSCAQQPGYSRDELTQLCTRYQEDSSEWKRLESLPADAVNIRRVAFRDMPGIDIVRSPRPEIWFETAGNRYLICYPAERSGCGQTTAIVSGEPGSYVQGLAEIVVC